MMTSHIAVTTFGLHNVASCGECLPNALETVASETLAITRGRVIPQCEENHLIGDWPYAARCIREPGHQIDWSHNPGTGPVILSKDQHFDRYGNVWV
jgi:hypothetical protein